VITQKVEALQHAANALAQAMHAQARQQPGGGTSPSSASNVHEGEVIDAEPVESHDGR
jgi:hypothetical protein